MRATLPAPLVRSPSTRPLILSLSKDEPLAQDGLVEDERRTRSWFDWLTTSVAQGLRPAGTGAS